jgi:uncharacterized repeat protein (TIGR04052 family)
MGLASGASARRGGAAAISLLLVLGAGTAAAQSRIEDVQCVGDADGDGQVTVDETVQAVRNGLESCGLVPVTLRFRAQVGARPFACGETYDDVGVSHSRWLPADMRFYVHDVRLVRPDRSEVRVELERDDWQYDGTALLDFENGERPCNNGTPETNTTIRGRAPAGTYTGVHFVLGVPFAQNHADPDDIEASPSPLNIQSMSWGWQLGHKFMRVDSFAIMETEFPEFRIHLGPAAATGGLWRSRAASGRTAPTCCSPTSTRPATSSSPIWGRSWRTRTSPRTSTEPRRGACPTRATATAKPSSATSASPSTTGIRRRRRRPFFASSQPRHRRSA